YAFVLHIVIPIPHHGLIQLLSFMDCFFLSCYTDSCLLHAGHIFFHWLVIQFLLNNNSNTPTSPLQLPSTAFLNQSDKTSIAQSIKWIQSTPSARCDLAYINIQDSPPLPASD